MQVLIVSGLPGGTRRYRCDHHRQQLSLTGVDSQLRLLEDAADVAALYADVVRADLVILHRVPYDDAIADLIDLAHLQGKPVVYETDDLVFDLALVQQIGLVDNLTPQQRQRFLYEVAQQGVTLQHVDCAITTTDALAAEIEKRGKPAFVHRNAASQEMILRSQEAIANRVPLRADVVTLGYFSGSGSHDRDFAVITPLLLELMQHNPALHLHIGGPLTLDARFHALQDRVHRTPYITWQELPAVIAAVDVNLAPLELENPFCQAKSEIKWMEAAFVAVPTIATATNAYRHAVTHGEDGFLAATLDDWRAALLALVENGDLRERMGLAAQRKVYTVYTPESAGQRLLATLQTVTAQFGKAPADGPTFALALAQRMQTRLAAAQAQIHELDQRLVALRSAHAQLQEEVGAVRADERARARRELAELDRRHSQTLQDLLQRIQQMHAVHENP